MDKITNNIINNLPKKEIKDNNKSLNDLANSSPSVDKVMSSNVVDIKDTKKLVAEMAKSAPIDVDKVAKIKEAISSGKYPVSRSLYFYIKNAHVGKIPGISEYIAEFTSEKSFGSDGYLQEKGLIPSPDAERAKIRTNALGLSLAWLSDFN